MLYVILRIILTFLKLWYFFRHIVRDLYFYFLKYWCPYIPSPEACWIFMFAKGLYTSFLYSAVSVSLQKCYCKTVRGSNWKCSVRSFPRVTHFLLGTDWRGIIRSWSCAILNVLLTDYHYYTRVKCLPRNKIIVWFNSANFVDCLKLQWFSLKPFLSCSGKYQNFVTRYRKRRLSICLIWIEAKDEKLIYIMKLYYKLL